MNMSRRPTIVATFMQKLLLVLLLCLPANALYVFTYPENHINGPENQSDDPIYHVGSTIDIQWKESQSNTVSIALWQAIPNTVGEFVCEPAAGLQSCDWTVKTARNLSVSDKFFFLMGAKGEDSYVAKSRQFIINGSSSNGTATTTQALPSISNVTLASSSPNGGLNPSTSGSGLSSGAKAGMGVGVGVGVLVIAGVAFILIILKRRRRQQSILETTEPNNGPVEAGNEGIFEAPGTMPEMTAELDHETRARLAGFKHKVVIDKSEGGPQELDASV
ncbi:uncharacterized protein N7477_001685 [Penicillium maclennaniae]|uniref:uncharacterized protein n=1 Tax=Penicillium maclennaniae TaxID=1343394 RepID=UPI0025413F93|nr:uncharacterized protein N7477_001685 [Penicillium maclennaniae]KAJ5681745.1 hypothetical protein N7477_001685 [Penicillium maclennaniae]